MQEEHRAKLWFWILSVFTDITLLELNHVFTDTEAQLHPYFHSYAPFVKHEGALNSLATIPREHLIGQMSWWNNSTLIMYISNSKWNINKSEKEKDE